MRTKLKYCYSKFLLSLIIFIFITTSISVNAASKFPTPTEYKYINDYVGIVNSEDTKSIISIGKELEDKTSAQSVIVIIDSLNGSDIESYANKLFRNWGIGQSGKDNGLLILLSLEDRAWRVEVGRGLEGAIPDALSNRVMTSLAKPYFLEGNYSKGLLNSYSKFADCIASEYGVTLDKSLNINLPSQSSNNSTSSGRSFGIFGGIFVFLLIFDLIFNRGRISTTLLQLILINNFHNRNGPRGGSGGGGGFGGFGGGSSNGGGSSGKW